MLDIVIIPTIQTRAEPLPRDTETTYSAAVSPNKARMTPTLYFKFPKLRFHKIYIPPLMYSQILSLTVEVGEESFCDRLYSTILIYCELVAYTPP